MCVDLSPVWNSDNLHTTKAHSTKHTINNFHFLCFTPHLSPIVSSNMSSMEQGLIPSVCLTETAGPAEELSSELQESIKEMTKALAEQEDHEDEEAEVVKEEDEEDEDDEQSMLLFTFTCPLRLQLA